MQVAPDYLDDDEDVIGYGPATRTPVDLRTLAGVLGLTTRTINQLCDSGVVVRISFGRYDLEASVKNYVEKLRQKTGNARDRLNNAQAEIAELKLAEQRGELVPAAAVAATWANMLADIRAGLLAVPERAAARASLDRATVEIIAAEIRETLEALAHG